METAREGREQAMANRPAIETLKDIPDLAQQVGRITALADLKARLALLKQHGATYYKDGLLELHLSNRDVPKQKKQPEDRDDVELGKV